MAIQVEPKANRKKYINIYSDSQICSPALIYKHSEEQTWCTHTPTHAHAIMLSSAEESSLYLIEVEAIFPQVAGCLLRAAPIRVKGICLLLLNILKYYSIYRVIYMLMKRLPLCRALTQLQAYVWVYERGLKERRVVRANEGKAGDTTRRWKRGQRREMKEERREDTDTEKEGDIPLGECHR